MINPRNAHQHGLAALYPVKLGAAQNMFICFKNTICGPKALNYVHILGWVVGVVKQWSPPVLKIHGDKFGKTTESALGEFFKC